MTQKKLDDLKKKKFRDNSPLPLVEHIKPFVFTEEMAISCRESAIPKRPMSLIKDILNDDIENEEKHHFTLTAWDMWYSLSSILKNALLKKQSSEKFKDGDFLFELQFIKKDDVFKFKLVVLDKQAAKILGIPQKQERKIKCSTDMWKFHAKIQNLVST